MRLRAALLALALAACGPLPAAERPAATAMEARGLTPDAEGLQPTGTALRIDFGRAEAGVVAAVTRLLGAPPVSAVPRAGCPGGFDSEVNWASGLTLAFRRGAFVGWRDAEGRTAGAICTSA